MRVPRKTAFIVFVFASRVGLVRAAELTKEEQAWLAGASRESRRR